MIQVNPATAFGMLHDFIELREGDWVLQNGTSPRRTLIYVLTYYLFRCEQCGSYRLLTCLHSRIQSKQFFRSGKPSSRSLHAWA